MLTEDEKPSDFMEVTEAEKSVLEEQDRQWVEPPRSFIDAWNARGDYNKVSPGSSGYKDYLVVARYDPDNAPDDLHPFFINNLWLTYGEALDVMSVAFPTLLSDSERCKARTLFPFKGDYSFSLERYGYGSRNIETLHILDGYQLGGTRAKDSAMAVKNTGNIAYDSIKLREIIGVLNVGKDTVIKHLNGSSGYWPNLERIWLNSIVKSVDFQSSPNIEIECWEYMIDNAANTSAITLTVHPDVFAKMTGDISNEAVAKLSEAERERWEAVGAKAASKNINIATI